MNRCRSFLVLVLTLAAPSAHAGESERFGRFGEFALYRGAQPSQVVLFVSGDGG